MKETIPPRMGDCQLRLVDPCGTPHSALRADRRPTDIRFRYCDCRSGQLQHDGWLARNLPRRMVSPHGVASIAI